MEFVNTKSAWSQDPVQFGVDVNDDGLDPQSVYLNMALGASGSARICVFMPQEDARALAAALVKMADKVRDNLDRKAGVIRLDPAGVRAVMAAVGVTSECEPEAEEHPEDAPEAPPHEERA